MDDIKTKPWWFRQTIADLDRHEGFREFAYPDPLSLLGKRYAAKRYRFGYDWAHILLERYGESEAIGRPWTYGHGFTKGVNPFSRITYVASKHKLGAVLLEHLYILDKLVPNWLTLPAVVRTVLANMAFNLGEQRLTKFRPTLNLIAKGDFDGAAARLKRTAWYKQVGIRAHELIHRLETLKVDPRYMIDQ